MHWGGGKSYIVAFFRAPEAKPAILPDRARVVRLRAAQTGFQKYRQAGLKGAGAKKCSKSDLPIPIPIPIPIYICKKVRHHGAYTLRRDLVQ